MLTILTVDDDVDALTTLRSALASAGHAVVVVATPREALEVLARDPIDVVLVATQVRDAAGLELCAKVVAQHSDVAVIVMSADDDVDLAIAAIRAGAFDFVRKPIVAATILDSVARAARRRVILRRIDATTAGTGHRDPEVIGECPAMRRILEVVKRVASTDAALLIGGANGTGKEAIARALHRSSGRREQPFVSVNCASLSAVDLESELFGWAPGTFADARQHDGLFRRAHGGTVFIDDVGDLPLGLQPKVLRAMTDGTVRAVNSTTDVPIDVRIVTATNQDLQRRVAEKRFRADLLFRVNAVEVTLPPLATRGDDVILLAQHFLARLALRGATPARALSPSAGEMLLRYDWPGNVRELLNCMERAAALTASDAIGPQDLPDAVRSYENTLLPSVADTFADVITLRELERRYVVRVMSLASGNKSTAARMLGIDRKTLYRKLGYSVDEPDERKLS